MASKGSVAKNGHITTTEYETEYIYPSGSEVLRGKRKKTHSLPDYSPKSNRAYIKNNSDGSFREMKFYDSKGKLFLEIAYHPEPSVNGRNRDEACGTVTIMMTYQDMDRRMCLKIGTISFKNTKIT